MISEIFNDVVFLCTLIIEENQYWESSKGVG
jgi:hypothetical protein